MTSNLSDERILEIARATLDTAMRLRVNIEREGLLAFARAILAEGSAAPDPEPLTDELLAIKFDSWAMSSSRHWVKIARADFRSLYTDLATRGAVVEPPEPRPIDRHAAVLDAIGGMQRAGVAVGLIDEVVHYLNVKFGLPGDFARGGAPVVPSSEPPEPDMGFDAIMRRGEEILRRGHPTESDSSKPEAAGEVEIRLDDDGALDEIVGGTGVHLEQMDTNHWWLAVYYPGGRVTCGLHARGKITAFVEREPDVKTEGGGASTKP